MWPRNGGRFFRSMNRPVRSLGFSRSGPPEGGTPNKWRPTDRLMIPMHAKNERGLSMNLMIRITPASDTAGDVLLLLLLLLLIEELRVRVRVRVRVRQTKGSWSPCMRKNENG